MIGITIRKNISLGDALQFSSVPENYFRATGEQMIDVSKHWFFDHNPYIVRDTEPTETHELWNYGPRQRDLYRPRPEVYLSNAEIHAGIFGVPAKLIRPRLYRFEEFPFEKRETILFHPFGRSHGQMPAHIIDHVLSKYKHSSLWQIGLPDDPELGIPRLKTPTLWDLASVISSAKMLIGVDSGPSWVAACYPDVIVKKVRTRPSLEALQTFVPLKIDNIHAHWDDRIFQVYNPSGDDIGFTQSYKKL